MSAHSEAMKARAVAGGHPADAMIGSMLTMLDEIPTASGERLYEITEHAATWFTSGRLWEKLPATKIGDHSASARHARRRLGDVAETVWLAAQLASDEAGR